MGYGQIQPPALAAMPTLLPTAASTADADRAALHTTASDVPNEQVSRLRLLSALVYAGAVSAVPGLR